MRNPNPSIEASLAVILGLLSCSLLAACGGSRQSAKPSDSGRAEQGDADDEESSPASSRPECDDGTCFACGEAACLTGMYCDTTARGGPSCFSLPECPQVSCGCVLGVLGEGCSCDDGSDGPSVTCR